MRDFFDVLCFEGDGEAVHLAIDLVVAVDEADAFGLHAAFEDFGGALQLQVCDHGHDVAVLKDVPVGVFDDALGRAGVVFDGAAFLFPIMATGEAFVGGGVLQNVVKGAEGAGHINCFFEFGGSWGGKRAWGTEDDFAKQNLARQLLSVEVEPCRATN